MATTETETNYSEGMSEHVFDTNNVEHYTLLEELSAKSSITTWDNSVSTMSINGTDDRVLVSNTEVQPYSAIVYIESYWGIKYNSTRGTGFMVSKDVVLTAAHVLYDPDKGGWPISIKVYPGKNGDGLFDNPYGSSYAEKAGVCTEWRAAVDSGLDDNETIATKVRNDWGAIKLILSLGNKTGTIPFRCPTNEELNSTTITVSGYPRYVYGNETFQQYKDSAPVSSYNDYLLYVEDLSASGGQSGAPMLNEKNIAFGIYTGTSNGKNRGSRITENLIYHVNMLINE